MRVPVQTTTRLSIYLRMIVATILSHPVAPGEVDIDWDQVLSKSGKATGVHLEFDSELRHLHHCGRVAGDSTTNSGGVLSAFAAFEPGRRLERMPKETEDTEIISADLAALEQQRFASAHRTLEATLGR